MPTIAKSFPNMTVSTSGPNAVGGPIKLLDDLGAITIFAPTLTTSSLIVQVEPTDTGTAFQDLKSGTANVTVPTSGAVTINPVAFRQLQVITTSTEAAVRTIVAVGSMTV